MPELPEVETVVRTLRPQIIGRRIQNIEVVLPKTLAAGQELLSYAIGSRISAVTRRAKVVVVGLGEPIAAEPPALTELPCWEQYQIYMVFHLKMTGSFFVHPQNTAPLRHTRLIIDIDDGRLFFDDIRTFGYCRIMRPADLKQWAFWQNLGPEPLDTAPQELARRFQTKKTSIKAALLDQRVVAGAGNIYADESLFRARIAPEAKACGISLTRLTVLAEALQEVLRISIEECGSSIRDYTDAFGNAGAFQNNFMVYGRKNKPCPVCQTLLSGTTVAGRSTVYCPNCQKQ